MRGYNQFQYNTKRYNADGVELSASETFSVTDDLKKNIKTKRSESLVTSDNVAKQITQKRLSEELNLAIWINLDRDPAQNDWGDQ